MGETLQKNIQKYTTKAMNSDKILPVAVTNAVHMLAKISYHSRSVKWLDQCGIIKLYSAEENGEYVFFK